MKLATKIGIGVIGVSALGVGGYFVLKAMGKDKMIKGILPNEGEIEKYIKPTMHGLPNEIVCGIYQNDALPLKTCSKGERVKNVQKYLNQIGFKVDVDGMLGQQTYDALLKRRPTIKGKFSSLVDKAEYEKMMERFRTPTGNIQMLASASFDGGEYDSQDDLL